MSVSKSLKRSFIAIAILFICLATFLFSMVKKAFEVEEAIIDKKYYIKGMDYQAVLNKYDNAAKAGWELNVPQQKLSVGQSKFIFHIKNLVLDKKERISQLKASKIEVSLESTATSKIKNRIITKFSSQSNNTTTFNGIGIVPASGRWELILKINLDNNKSLYRRMIIFI